MAGRHAKVLVNVSYSKCGASCESGDVRRGKFFLCILSAAEGFADAASEDVSEIEPSVQELVVGHLQPSHGTPYTGPR